MTGYNVARRERRFASITDWKEILVEQHGVQQSKGALWPFGREWPSWNRWIRCGKDSLPARLATHCGVAGGFVFLAKVDLGRDSIVLSIFAISSAECASQSSAAPRVMAHGDRSAKAADKSPTTARDDAFPKIECRCDLIRGTASTLSPPQQNRAIHLVRTCQALPTLARCFRITNKVLSPRIRRESMAALRALCGPIKSLLPCAEAPAAGPGPRPKLGRFGSSSDSQRRKHSAAHVSPNQP